MVAFKEEFPYLRTPSGQLFEFNRDWLHAAITRAANEAGYPGWWLTEHVTESIAFYLHLRNDENVVAFSQLSQTVRDVLAAIDDSEQLARRSYEAGELRLPEWLLLRRELLETRLTYVDHLFETAASGVAVDVAAGVLR